MFNAITIRSGFFLTLYLDYANNQLQYCSVALVKADKHWWRKVTSTYSMWSSLEHESVTSLMPRSLFSLLHTTNKQRHSCTVVRCMSTFPNVGLKKAFQRRIRGTSEAQSWTWLLKNIWRISSRLRLGRPNSPHFPIALDILWASIHRMEPLSSLRWTRLPSARGFA